MRELRACQELTGVQDVPARLVDSAMLQARQRFSDERIEALLQAHELGGLSAVEQNPDLLGPARALTYFLYMGMLPDEHGAEVERGAASKPAIRSEADYFESLVWKVIQAHPRGLSGGYYGHWHYPPEDTHA